MDRFVIRAFEINVKGARKENFSKLSKRRKERKETVIHESCHRVQLNRPLITEYRLSIMSGSIDIHSRSISLLYRRRETERVN